jgi:D-alanyl-D-alanine carboxypeptidase (penicillin-binding protein 5/6)
MARKAKKKKSGIRIFAALLLMVIIAAFAYTSIFAPENHQILEKEYDDKTSSYYSLELRPDSSDDRTTPVPPSIEPDLSVSIFPDQLNSPNAILLRRTDDFVLMQKNSEEKIYPASLTKMMTAIVAIENLPDLNEEIKLTSSAFQGLYEADASMAGFQPDEQVKAIDLLYGVLLPSGAECCVALADQIAGSEQNFAKIMNQKAAELGMDSTHFENVTGLHNENHYTTVKDLAVLLSYALKNDTFREIFTSPRHSTQPTNKHPNGITFHSTMFKELGNQNTTDGEILGGKTGYTDEAGLCLASLARVGKQEYILITAGARGNHKSEQYHVTDALAVYDSLGKE